MAEWGEGTDYDTLSDYLADVNRRLYGGGDGGGRRSTDRFGGWVDNERHYHGPPDGTKSGGGWMWQSGTMGRQSDGTYADGMWVRDPDVPASQCSKKPIVGQGISEEAIWQGILKDWAESHPNDPVAPWILYQGTPGAERERRAAWRRGFDVPPATTRFPEPAWIGEMGLEITGAPTQRITGYEEPEWMGRRGEPIYEEVPGETIGLRPMGGQLSLTSDQMEQLMYYQSYLKGGQPSTAKGWLQTAAYRMPNWWTDFLAQSEAAMPWKAAPKAQVGAARQR